MNALCQLIEAIQIDEIQLFYFIRREHYKNVQKCNKIVISWSYCPVLHATETNKNSWFDLTHTNDFSQIGNGCDFSKHKVNFVNNEEFAAEVISLISWFR